MDRTAFLLGVVFLSVAGVSTTIAATDWKDTLEQKLEATIFRTTETALFDGNRITDEGARFVVTRTGILGSPARHLGAVNTKIRQGAVTQPGGVAALFSERNTTQFKVGDIVYVTDVEVRDRTLVVEILGEELIPTIERGTTVQTRYKGQLEFEVQESVWADASLDAIRALVGEVLRPPD
jgi:hypothetical protein